MQVIRLVAISTLTLSVVSWVYRFVEEHMRYQELVFYILVPISVWLLFAGPLFLLRSDSKALRIVAVILLLPTSALWVISVLVGFYGLRIH